MARYRETASGWIEDTVLGEVFEKNLANLGYQRFIASGEEADEFVQPQVVIVYGRSLAIDEARVQTSGVTPAELFRQTIPVLTGYMAKLRVIGISDNLLIRTIEAIVVVARGSGDNATIIQNASSQDQTVLGNHRTNATSGGWLIVPSVSGSDYLITVTGSSGRVVDWRLTGQVESFTPGGETP